MARLVTCVVGSGLVAAHSARQLPDERIAGCDYVNLDGDDWQAVQLDPSNRILQTIPAMVPGDLVTDLERHGLVGDPLYEMNFRNMSFWNDYPTTWSYTRNFSAAGEVDHLLVFDGIKMGATILLDGKELGQATDQFLRYSFPVASGEHTLEVRFNNVDVRGRFMACSGGWDWGPYSTAILNNDHYYTYGIWRSVYVVSTTRTAAIIEHVVPHTFYLGAHPTRALEDGQHGGFLVQVRSHLQGGSKGAQGSLRVSGSWGQEASKVVRLAANEDRVEVLNLTASASEVALWWPRSLGNQNLYNVTVSFLEVEATRRLGFRVAALVTGNDTDPEYVKTATSLEGSDDHGLYYRVNGAAIFTRGSNVIPMDNMEGRYSDAAHRQMVISAAEASMNMLRVWGGGVFLPDVFYDTADEVGVLVYHDLMYTTTTRSHEPTGTADEAAEISHQVRRLSHHPSIFVWNSCNECSGKDLYISFAMTQVAAEDRSRPIWPACPSHGWAAGVRRLDSLPTGGVLQSKTQLDGQLLSTIEQHGPYANGNGWEAVNMAPAHTLLIRDTNLPVPLKDRTPHGLALKNKFTSEFGASVFPSFESLAPTLAQEHWGIHGGAPEDNCSVGDVTNPFWKDCSDGNVMAQRNYPCDNLILGYFGKEQRVQLDDTGETALKRQLYQCMLAQTLSMKSVIELQRSSNTFGLLTWQLNEIWPTGGWGSLEYGTVGFTPGQVLGGRWRPLHHLFLEHLYADVMATCGTDGLCFVKNDGIREFAGRVQIQALQIADGSGQGSWSAVADLNVSLPAGPGESQWFTAEHWSDFQSGDHVLVCSVVETASSIVASNHVLLPAAPSELQLPGAELELEIGEVGPDGSVPVTISASKPALYVLLTTLAQGRFSKNAVLVPNPGEPVTVRFLPFQHLDIELFRKSLRAEDLASNMPLALPQVV